MSTTLVTAQPKINPESSGSDKQHIERDRLYPFIFARATEQSQKLYDNELGDLVLQDWVVIIALPDFKVYDSRWMHDPEQGDFCLIPDVNISFDRIHAFPSFAEARKFVGQWWVKQSLLDADEIEHGKI